MEGRFLRAGDVARLRAEAVRAEAEGAGALFLGPSPLGDPVVLAAALSAAVSEVLIGVCLRPGAPGRHPTVLARDLTALDHVCGGRTVLCLVPPFGDDVREAIGLCRAMWRDGTARSEGPRYPVPGAVNLPRPPREGSPRIALDLTGGDDGGAAERTGALSPAALEPLADLVLRATADPDVCRVERT